MTIPGVEMVVAVAIVAAIGAVTRFDRSQKLVSYLGLNPSVRQSGPGPAYHGRITWTAILTRRYSRMVSSSVSRASMASTAPISPRSMPRRVTSSAALTLSGVPFMGPIGAAQVGVMKREIRVNATVEEMKDSSLDLVVAGTADAVLMVESEAQELSEETMLKAVMAGHAAFQPVLQAIIRLAEKAAKEPRELGASDRSEVEKAVMEVGEADLRGA
jgi:polyribonucleotide nucleotidyltransferase